MEWEGKGMEGGDSIVGREIYGMGKVKEGKGMEGEDVVLSTEVFGMGRECILANPSSPSSHT